MTYLQLRCLSQKKKRWVDTNKGDGRSPEIRCRLVAKEVKKRNNTEEESVNFFATTPPLEAVKLLISEAMTRRVSRNNRPLKLSFVDVKGTSVVLRELYVEFPPEANEPPGYCLAVATRHVWHA